MTGLTRGSRRRGRREARRASRLALPVAIATVLLVIPSSIVVAGPLRSNGSPVRLLGLLGLGLFLLGALTRLREHAPAAGSRLSGEAIVLVYAAAAVLSYGVAFGRGLTPVESSGALRALLFTAAVAGIALATATSLRGHADVSLMAGVLVAGGAFSATVGIVQFYTPVELAELLRPPGFVLNTDLATGERSDFTRVLGSAAHPIEMSVALAALVPMALHFAGHAASLRRRRAAGGAAVLMLAAIPMSVSRSGVLALAVALPVYAVVWSGRQRLNALVLGAVGVVAFRTIVPGLLGTLRSLIQNAEDDPSVQGRTDDYELLYRRIGEEPLVGRGLGTFRPEQYIFVDNQWLLTTVESGLVGAAALLLLLLGGMSLARGAYHRASAPVERSLPQAVVAGLLAVSVSALTFDLFSFQQAGALTFLLVGMAIALHRDSFAAAAAEPDPAVPVLAGGRA